MTQTEKRDQARWFLNQWIDAWCRSIQIEDDEYLMETFSDYYTGLMGSCEKEIKALGFFINRTSTSFELGC